MTNDIIGIDPGPNSCGWAALSMAVGCGKHRVLDAGEFDASGPPPEAFAGCRVFAIERPSYRPIGGRDRVAQSIAMAKALVDTAWVAGRLAGLLGAGGNAVLTPTCGEVRRALMGRPSCTDQELKWALEHFVELPKRSNVHVRDAVAAGVVGFTLWQQGAQTVETARGALGRTG